MIVVCSNSSFLGTVRGDALMVVTSSLNLSMNVGALFLTSREEKGTQTNTEGSELLGFGGGREGE